MAQSPETQQLIALFNAGRISDVEVEARKFVDRDPQFGFGWMALGMAQHFQGGDGLPMLRRAVALLPDDAEAHSNLGNALRDRGELQEAQRSYRKALEINPAFMEAHSNLGNVLHELGQVDEAARCHRRSLELNPDYASAHANLGRALKALNRAEEAAASYRRALELEPDLPEALNGLGIALRELGQPEEAVRHFRSALESRPDSAEAHNNLGIAAHDIGQLAEAVRSLRRALQLKPDYAEAHSNLGGALIDLGQLDEAVRSLRRALELKPEFPAAHLNLGNALKDLGRLQEALPCYRRALELKPDYVEARSNQLFAKGFLQAQPAIELKEEARQYGAFVARDARPFTDWPGLSDRDPGRALNVGLVSGDLRNHPVGFFIEGVVAALNRDRIKLQVYQTFAKTDEVTERLKRHIPGWTPVMGIADRALAERIRADGIDILVDLAGHSAHNRLPVFAWKPAPIQLAWLGYFATTGVPGMDYVLVDPWSVPAGEEAHFTEEVWRLPETRQCFTPPQAAAEVAPLPALASGQVTFGSFNQLAKVNDTVLDAWARVLNAAPRARLFLKANQLNDATVQEELRARFARQGIDGARLAFEGFSSRAEYLASYHRVDVALDTFPYPGGTTTMEALWMGVPVLTLKGDRMLSRQGECLLMNAGLKDWIAADVDDFVRRAVNQAADLAALAQLRKTLRTQVQASPLLDASRFARHFEAALRGMWRRRCDAHA